MPTQIDCLECGGEVIYFQKNPDCRNCECVDECPGPNKDYCFLQSKCTYCKDGKITVYTASEIQKAVEDERDSCILDITQWVHEWKKKTYIKPYIDVVLHGMTEAITSRGKPE